MKAFDFQCSQSFSFLYYVALENYYINYHLTILQTLAWTYHCPVDRRLSILDIRMSRPRENILDFQEKKIAKN